MKNDSTSVAYIVREVNSLNDNHIVSIVRKYLIYSTRFDSYHNVIGSVRYKSLII